MGWVGAGQVNVSYERYFAEHVTVGIPFVAAAVSERDGERGGSCPVEDDGGHVEAFVDLTGVLGVVGPPVGVPVQVDCYEHEALVEALIDCGGF